MRISSLFFLSADRYSSVIMRFGSGPPPCGTTKLSRLWFATPFPPKIDFLLFPKNPEFCIFFRFFIFDFREKWLIFENKVLLHLERFYKARLSTSQNWETKRPKLSRSNSWAKFQLYMVNHTAQHKSSYNLIIINNKV